jgi:glycosyltransferase 2 family protein
MPNKPRIPARFSIGDVVEIESKIHLRFSGKRGVIIDREISRHTHVLRILTVVALVGLVLFLKIDLRETFAILGAANVWLVALSVLGFVSFLMVKAWRWQVVLRDLGVPVAYREAVRLYALGLGAGMLTPGNVGDVVKVAYFRERGFSQAVISVALDRVWDVLILLLLAGSGIFLFSQVALGQWIMLALLIGGTGAALVITIHPRTQAWLFAMFMRLRRNKSAAQAEAQTYAPATLTPKQVLVQFLISVLATLIVYARLFLVAAAIGIFLPPLPFVAAMSLASIAQLIAIAPFGLGPREGILLLLAPALGITAAQALALSALLFLLQLVNGIVGFAVWLLERPGNENQEPRTEKQAVRAS